MKWSKLKQLVEQGFAPSLAKRLTINSTAYGACTCGHAWLTLDGEVIANFCTRAKGWVVDGEVQKVGSNSAHIALWARSDLLVLMPSILSDLGRDEAGLKSADLSSLSRLPRDRARGCR